MFNIYNKLTYLHLDLIHVLLNLFLKLFCIYEQNKFFIYQVYTYIIVCIICLICK